MAMMGSAQPWNGQDQPLGPATEDDFQFLDMESMGNIGDGLSFDFHAFQDANVSSMITAAQGEAVDTQMSGTEPPDVPLRRTGVTRDHVPAITTAASHLTVPAHMVPSPTAAQAINDIDAQIQYLQQQRAQQQQRQIHEQQTAYYATQNHAIPPTPQSLDMQPSTNPFYVRSDTSAGPSVFGNRFQQLKEQQQQQQHPQQQQQEMAFTPLVSPAVTPLDPQFSVDASFSIPGTYFSPITSPALHAQADAGAAYYQGQMAGGSNSPVEADLQTSSGQNNSTDLSKKARKNNATKAKGKANVRQSPISKPQRRRTTNSTIVTQALTEAVEGSPNKAPLSRSDEGEENSSVSPEALSDMPPPPLPHQKSAGKSPRGPQPTSSSPAQRPTVMGVAKPSPATPASLLMKQTSTHVGKPSSLGGKDQSQPESLDSFQLPEPVAFPEDQMSPLDTQMRLRLAPEAANPAKGAAPFQSLPSPAFVKPTTTASASQSPQLVPGSSTPNPRKTPQMTPRGSKKRTSSVHVSPALRPKISPNIKPLLPGTPGASAEDTASRLLASKSNYQNILEGNTMLSYPSELSTNLTSKRTSHKIAEQGRRNRINSALQEIATLLPKSPGKDNKSSDDGEPSKKDGKQSSTPSSKACTVEMAIEYIKQLRQQVEEANRRAEEAERKLEMERAT